MVEFNAGSDIGGTNTNGVLIFLTTQDKSNAIKILATEPYLFENPHQILRISCHKIRDKKGSLPDQQDPIGLK